MDIEDPIEQEEEEDFDQSAMSPEANILKLGAEKTVAGIANYILHNLGRKVVEVKKEF